MMRVVVIGAGQSTAAVALGGLRVAQMALRELGAPDAAAVLAQRMMGAGA